MVTLYEYDYSKPSLLLNQQADMFYFIEQPSKNSNKNIQHKMKHGTERKQL